MLIVVDSANAWTFPKSSGLMRVFNALKSTVHFATENGKTVPEDQTLSTRTPWKINTEPQNGGLEDDVPFQWGDFQVPAVHFPGV